MNFGTFFMREKDEEKAVTVIETIIRAIVFALFPVVIFYLMEWYEHNPFQEVRLGAQGFNILLFELLAWTLFFLIGSGRWAIRILAFVAMSFGLVNHYVMAFRSTPFVPWDIFSIKTAASVVGNYDFTPERQVVIVTIIFVAILILVQFFSFAWKKKISWRLTSAVASILALCFFVNLLQDENFQTEHYLYPFLFTPVYMTKVNGMAVTFAMNLEYISIDKPAGYKEEVCEEILETYESSQNFNPEELPNIIVVMDEAFSDLSVLGEVESTQDYMPFIHELQQGAPNTITGELNVSVCGGNTANTEFEFLTGHTMAFLPNGSIPYQQYIKGEIPSLASHLTQMGYSTYAMHPYGASGWERDQVYPWMGFEHTIFLDDYEQPRRIRKYVSDKSNFENIISIYEDKEEGTPIFIFNVTMQNHGGYTDIYSDFSHDVTVPAANNPALDQYLSLMKITDAEFENLVDYFSAQEEKTIIAFFGDHQPNTTVTKSIYSGEEDEKRYIVPYVIWANYDIEEANGVDTSANYLSAHLLQTAGVITTPYQNFLLEMEESYPILSSVKKEITTENKELLDTYQQLQYYYMFDWEED